ncbi:hypothetical protein QL285_045479 [Trifolium repens]|nr:hypothetical protein QL285_045479 [Trifolium repens]
MSSSSSVSNTTAYEIPDCGCKKPMRMFISNSNENPKRKFWKCANSRLHGVRSCDLFTWDGEIEGHPPYVRPTQHVPRNIVNRNSEETSCGANRSNCKCSNVLTQVEKILQEIEVNKHEKMKLKLHNAKKTLKMYRNLLFLSWMVVFAYFKMFC